jgi:CHAT domain-containing protein
MLTTMAVTPGMRNLKGVVKERDEVLKSFSGCTTIELQEPHPKQVLECLKGCSIAHFACHGHADAFDPSNSGLVFKKQCEESEPPEAELMTVRDISLSNLDQAQIAYLSACSTAENGVTRLENESIHVVSAFNVAGFRHVIGCLWPSLDSICVTVAHEFYASLFRHRDLQ